VAAEPGEYTIVVKAGNRTLSRDTRILEDAWFERVF
jgi:hypothetical protein